MSKNHDGKKKQNPPHYMRNNTGKPRDLVDMQREELLNRNKIQEGSTPVTISKFRLGIDKNTEPLITIDNTLHFMNKNQFDAFTRGIINLSKKINPEIDYSELFKEKQVQNQD